MYSGNWSHDWRETGRLLRETDGTWDGNKGSVKGRGESFILITLLFVPNHAYFSGHTLVLSKNQNSCGDKKPHFHAVLLNFGLFVRKFSCPVKFSI